VDTRRARDAEIREQEKAALVIPELVHPKAAEIKCLRPCP